MKSDQAFVMAEEIVRLVQDLEKEFNKEIQESRNHLKSGWYFRQVAYRNWNDAVVNALPTGGFLVALWADVFGTYPGRGPVMQSKLVDAFVEKYRDVIAEWELLGSVGD